MSNLEVNTTEAYRAEREALAKRADTYGIVKLMRGNGEIARQPK